MKPIILVKSTLRPFAPADIHSLAEQANNIKIWKQLQDIFPHPYTLEDAKNWINFVNSKNCEDLQLAIEVEGSVVGGIGLIKKKGNFRHTGELGYWLGEAYWGQGIITEAVEGILNYGFKTLKLTRIYAGCFEENIASQRVLKKCGFQQEGILRKAIIKDEKTIDEYCFGILAEEFFRP